MVDDKQPYKINIGETYKIKRKDITKGEKHYTFFTIPVKKKDKSGNSVNGEKNVHLVDGQDIQDGQTIKILDMFEDFYKKDYTTIFTLVITEYEIVDTQQEDEMSVYTEALNEYEKELGGALEEW